ncbi:protein SSUH2 homolog isoform X1 [Anolis carolinensis]|uniref:protein SSUH2 homolog isoform X1 n=1 Tax=Anolis carolinensis TaxID=28377 RepID=UPI002F2B5817
MIETPEPFAPPSYEDVTSGDGNNFHSPHSIDLVHEGEPPTSQRNRNATAISEDVAKEVFAQYVASHCCYSKDPAKEMVICDLRSFDTYRYRLETFSESSSCKWKSVPYRGEPVDPSLQAHAPYPWDVQVEVSPMFKDQKKKVKVPHTSSVKECPQCRGQGDTSCSSCGGSGLVSSGVLGRDVFLHSFYFPRNGQIILATSKPLQECPWHVFKDCFQYRIYSAQYLCMVVWCRKQHLPNRKYFCGNIFFHCD